MRASTRPFLLASYGVLQHAPTEHTVSSNAPIPTDRLTSTVTATPSPADLPRDAASATPRVLFACGGTGGHVYPAIAVADAVRRAAPGAAIAFAGTRDRMEWQAVPKAGYPIHAITVSGFQRGLSASAIKRNAVFPFKLAKGLWESWRLVGSFRPDVVVGTGGYASGPVGLAASLRGVPLVVQEQNAYAGATNKLLAGRAERIYIAFEAARDAFPGAETVLSGNPVRADLLDADRDEALAHFDIPAATADGTPTRVLLAMGGSLGAEPINSAMERALPALLDDASTYVVWQAGSRYHDALAARVDQHPRLRLMPYLDRMDLAYAAADLAFCRSGAITCSELALTGTPSILTPSPNVTADHQTKNAAALADAGAAVLLPERELDIRYEAVVRDLLADDAERATMSTAAVKLSRPAAADDIAAGVLDLFGKRRGA